MIINPNPQEWRSLKVGQTVIISNENAVMDVTDNEGPFPLELPITEMMKAQERNGLAEWRLFRLGEFEFNFYLMAKIVGQNVKTMLLRDSAFWQPTSRSELAKNNVLFLFAAPSDFDMPSFESNPFSFAPKLKYASFFQRGTLDGSDLEWKYVLRQPGELHGEAVVTPGGWSPIVSIAEYGAEEAGVLEPELVVLEVGEAKSGMIKVLTGSEITCDWIYIK